MLWTDTFWRRKLGIAPVYDRQIWFSIKQQVVLTTLAVLVLDMGDMARGLAAVMIGFWIGTMMILVRRPFLPSKADLLFVRWGFSVLAVVMLTGALGVATMFAH
jgi:hypothetical protein